MTEEKNQQTGTEEKSSQNEDKENKTEEPKQTASVADESAPTSDKQDKQEEQDKIEVPEKFKNLVREIEQMSVLDLAELVKILESKFGVSSAAPVVMSSAQTASADKADSAEEKSVFNIELAGIGDKKIEVIKAVRDITEKGLKEAKDLVDAAMSSPQIVKENVKKEEAEEIKKKLETAGAKVELK